MKISFFLHTPSADQTSIVISLFADGRRLKLSTGITVPPQAWSKTLQKVTPKYNSFSGRTFKDSNQLNFELSKISNDIIEFYRSKRVVSYEELKDFVQRLLDPARAPQNTSNVANLIDLYLKEADSIGKYVKESRKKYITLRNLLLEYEFAIKCPVKSVQLNVEFYQSFMYYMNSKKNLVNSTAFGLIKRLKTVMKWAQSKGLADNVDLSEFKAPEKESINAVALTEAELDAIERLDLHPTESLYKVRDTFLLQCYTGLRYSDIQNLKRENLKESEIVITTKKTSDPIIIPIHTRLKNLLDRYPDFVFPTMSNQKMNAYIKIICARAEINEPVQIVKFYGKERKEERVPKHQIISTHTARRTFITLSLKKSILPEMVMKISGHKDRKSFQKYVKIAQNEAVESVREAWKK